MPTLKEALSYDVSGYTPIGPTEGLNPKPDPLPTPSPIAIQTGSPFTRCPLPPIFNQNSPAADRQFFKGGLVPQYRLLSSIQAAGGTSSTSSGSAGVTITGTSSGSGSASGSSSGSVASKPATQGTSASIRTALLSPGQTFTSSAQLSTAFQLLAASANTACRIQLYGTALAQQIDASRVIDTPPPAGTGQNIIIDLVLDTAPYTWSFQNRIGANADNPRSSTVYVTITNLGNAAQVVSVTLNYIPL